MRLTDNERRDAIKYIQEGKPLPEKYRFLLFEGDREVELVWNGKTQEICNLVLPFQTIEHIDEPRSQRIEKGKEQLLLFDTSGRQIKGWTNKLIWGDNKLILSSLKNGPMRREIEKQGGLKLIYIDPPFVPELRKRIKEWRDKGYEGATATSKALLSWWFKQEHLAYGADLSACGHAQAGGNSFLFQYYFAQREAVETIIWLYDVAGVRNKYDLLPFDSLGRVSPNMFDEDWLRLVIKMATGSGKTKVMSLLLAWSYFHKLYEPKSELSRNFLLITPNIVVLERIKTDFDGLKIFYQDPILPDNGYEGRSWQDDFQITLHLQDDLTAISPTGNIFLTNIHRVYEGDVRESSFSDEDLTDYFLGKKPVSKTNKSLVELSNVVRDIDEIVVFNDEAHHIHDPKMAWFKSIQDINNKLRQKDKQIALQIDCTATPKHNNGGIFVQTISDYPLVEAIHQGVVKTPVLPDEASRGKLQERQSAIFTEKYEDYVNLGIEEWRKTSKELEPTGKKAINALTVRDVGDAQIKNYTRLSNSRPFVVNDRAYISA